MLPPWTYYPTPCSVRRDTGTVQKRLGEPDQVLTEAALGCNEGPNDRHPIHKFSNSIKATTVLVYVISCRHCPYLIH